MMSMLRTVLLTALWYGTLAAVLIFVVVPWLHTGVGFPLNDGVTLPMYQKRALASAAIGYPLLCAVLIGSAAYRAKSTVAGAAAL